MCTILIIMNKKVSNGTKTAVTLTKPCKTRSDSQKEV